MSTEIVIENIEEIEKKYEELSPATATPPQNLNDNSLNGLNQRSTLGNVIASAVCKLWNPLLKGLEKKMNIVEESLQYDLDELATLKDQLSMVLSKRLQQPISDEMLILLLQGSIIASKIVKADKKTQVKNDRANRGITNEEKNMSVVQ